MFQPSQNGKSSRFRVLKSPTAVLIAACVLFSIGGCSIVKRASQAVWRLIVPIEIEYFTPVPTVTDDLQGEDVTPEPVMTDDRPTPEPVATDGPVIVPQSGNVPYFNIYNYHGTENLRSEVPVSWMKGSSVIKTEVMPLDICQVLWPVGYMSQTMNNAADMDGDDVDETLAIEPDKVTKLRGIFLARGDVKVDLLSLVSDEFWDTISPIMDSDGTLTASECVVEADAMDLDGDGYREIVIAIGDNNTIIAVSVLAYTGGSTLYTEVGGIIGHRLLYITEDHTLYVPYGNPVNWKYVEFLYEQGQFGVVGYSMD